MALSMVIASLTDALKIMNQKPEDSNDPPCNASAEERLAQHGFFLNADLQGSPEGAQLAAGGTCLERSTEGFYMAPALLLDTTSAMRINREEVFGPVASVIRVKDYEAALAESNNTPFGLSAGIATTSLKYATHFKRHSQAGMVMVNLPTAGVDYHVPFGGRKGSSFGSREQGRYAQEFFTTVKTAYIGV